MALFEVDDLTLKTVEYFGQQGVLPALAPAQEYAREIVSEAFYDGIASMAEELESLIGKKIDGQKYVPDMDELQREMKNRDFPGVAFDDLNPIVFYEQAYAQWLVSIVQNHREDLEKHFPKE